MRRAEQARSSNYGCDTRPDRPLRSSARHLSPQLDAELFRHDGSQDPACHGARLHSSEHPRRTTDGLSTQLRTQGIDHMQPCRIAHAAVTTSTAETRSYPRN